MTQSGGQNHFEEKGILMTAKIALPLPCCTQLIHQLFYYLDESRYGQLVSLFEEKGIWHRQGEMLTGHEQILRAMAKRPTTQRIRHVITNAFIESSTDGLTDIVAYMTAYRFDDATLRTGPVEISRPFRLSVVRATLRNSEDAWKIAEMRLTPEFEFIAETRLSGEGK
jgi:hypothetical protein